MAILIHLTRGQVTIVDDEDADLAEQNWYSQPRQIDSGYGFYAGKKIPHPDSSRKQKTLLMHRVIMAKILGRDMTRSECVDHIDGDGLNNTRSNLRLASYSQNQYNRKVNKNSSTGVKGVRLNKEKGQFEACISLNGCRKYLGLFPTLDEAREVRRKAAEEFHGKFANHGDGCVVLKKGPEDAA